MNGAERAGTIAPLMSEMTISVNGIQISVTDEAKKRAVLSVLGLSLASPQTSIFDSPPEDDAEYFIHDRDVLAQTVELLRAIRRGEDGIGTLDVMNAFGVTNPRAMGGRIAKTNRFLSQVGFAKGAAYKAINTAQGRIWKAGRKIDEALAQLEPALG